MDDVILRGWREVERRDELTSGQLLLYIGPQGQTCATVHEVFEQHQAARPLWKLPQHELNLLQELLKQPSVEEDFVSFIVHIFSLMPGVPQDGALADSQKLAAT